MADHQGLLCHCHLAVKLMEAGRAFRQYSLLSLRARICLVPTCKVRVLIVHMSSFGEIPFLMSPMPNVSDSH